MLLKGALVEKLEAEGTCEVVWVELLAHGSNTPAGNGFLALGT